MSKVSLEIRSVNVSYFGNKVLDNIDLKINAGEMFGLIGLNGAGKTSLIKCILGLRDQDSGEISVFGNQKDSASSKAGLAYLPEKFEPPWFLTGMEFIRFSLNLYSRTLPDEEIRKAAESLALDTKALKRRMHTYSKGMRQKLGLLGTLLTGCPLFILDEPMSGLDPKARALVKKMISEMRNQERTFFLSSHILSDMDEICDRVAVLHEGIIRFVGTPQKLKEETKTQNLEKAFLEYIEKKQAA